MLSRNRLRRQGLGRRSAVVKPFLPKRFENVAFGFLLAGMMSFLVTGLATLLAAGPGSAFVALWMKAWLSSWAVAFPVVLIVAPIVRRVVQRIIIED